ncbi:MAG: hypothetical protein MSIBF_00350 [Candidatus Altiarchaeales archaeon IMC4]|nr:MAG: hypothetical protein MSIBF_00350 [Candidatus Altiarchaeales archaeon IMC4]
MATVKKKMLIKGEKVHDVGYRLLLTNLADDLGIGNFNAKNVKANGRQVVRVLLGSSDENINKFFDLAKKPENFPEHAKVDSGAITIEDCEEYVGTLDSFRMRFMTEQQYKFVDAANGLLCEFKGSRNDTNQNFANLTKETRNGFTKTDNDFNTINTKYGILSENINAIAQSMNKIFEEFVAERKDFKKELAKERKEARTATKEIVAAILTLAKSKT